MQSYFHKVLPRKQARNFRGGLRNIFCPLRTTPCEVQDEVSILVRKFEGG